MCNDLFVVVLYDIMHRINRCRKLRKYILPILLISILPGICFGASARYTQLVREKQRKMEQLEKCMGTNKGLQIAGISTLGLTAVGVAGNIAEANIIKKNEKTLEKQNTTLAEKEEEYNIFIIFMHVLICFYYLCTQL